MSKDGETKTISDVRQLGAENLPTAEFPGNGATEFRIFMEPAVDTATREHAVQDTSIEVCGVLVGRWKRDSHGPFVAITASIRGDAAASKLAEVTFTHETWAKINAKMDSEFRDDMIVGWYHTHPDFGIFLSDRDRFIHDHFFAGPGQVAYVIDPIRKTRGFFTWKEGKPIPAATYWIGKEMHIGDSNAETKRESHARSEPAAKAHPEGPGVPEVTDISWMSLTMIGMVVTIVFILCSFLTSQLNAMRSAGEQMHMEEATVLRYGLAQGLRPELAGELNQLFVRMSLTAETAAKIDAAPVAATTQAAADRANALSDLRAQLELCRRDLDELRRKYSLSPTEAAVLRKLILDKVGEISQSQLGPPMIDTGGSQGQSPDQSPVNSQSAAPKK